METGKLLSRNYKLAVTGAFGALVVVLGITGLGFIRISPVVSYTILQVPVILAAILGGFGSGVSVGAIFGLMSLIQASMAPAGGLDPLFVNPAVSVLPRVLIGVVAYGVYTLLCKIPHMPETVAAVIAAYLGTFTNTVLVFGALFLVYFDKISPVVKGAGYFAVVAAHLPGCAVEGTIGAVIAAAVVGSTILIQNKKSRLNTEADMDETEK